MLGVNKQQQQKVEQYEARAAESEKAISDLQKNLNLTQVILNQVKAENKDLTSKLKSLETSHISLTQKYDEDK